MATGAGADRFSTGMAKSFGKIVGVAARVKKGEVIGYVRLNNQFLEVGKRSLVKTALKLGLPVEIAQNQMRELTKELIKVKIIKEKKEKVVEVLKALRAQRLLRQAKKARPARKRLASRQLAARTRSLLQARTQANPRARMPGSMPAAKRKSKS